MGRKIPGKKHRGVNDPEKQQAERFAKIKDKINSAPTNPDDQQVSSTLSRFIELKNKTRQGLFNKKQRKIGKTIGNKNPNKINKRRPEKAVPKFQQLPNESDKQFKYRVNKICNEFIKETKFEDKYRVDIERNQNGEVEKVVKRAPDELDVLVKKLKKEKLQKKIKKKAKKKLDDGSRLTKSQKWTLKKLEKRSKHETNKEEDNKITPQKEIIKFGEVAHAPPTLSAPRRVEKIQGAARPGQKQLLLKSMLNNNNASSSNSGNSGVQKKTIDKKGKRKDLPNALRRQLDTQQKEIIQAYKMLKTQRKNNKNTI